MTKYVGRHRATSKMTGRKVFTVSTLALVGIGSLSAGTTSTETTHDFSPVLSQTTGLPTPDKTFVVPEPPDLPGHGLDELEQWLEDGAPGYIPEESGDKGILKPEPPVVVIQAVCERGPASALGLTPNAATVYEVVCALFPEVTAFGGIRPGDWGDHGTGNAIDAMIDSESGDILAQWLLDHWNELPLKYIIWEQKISYGGEWAWMEDRGSPTQNHYDHVHISVS